MEIGCSGLIGVNPYLSVFANHLSGFRVVLIIHLYPFPSHFDHSSLSISQTVRLNYTDVNEEVGLGWADGIGVWCPFGVPVRVHLWRNVRCSHCFCCSLNSK